MKAIEIKDTTKINDYKEVDKLELSSITKNDGDKELLSGMIISGYEMKFGKVNENMEVFDKGCLNEYLEEYFVKNKLNVPVTILHRDDLQHLAGRVLVVESNGVGFYFVVYIPKTYVNYQIVRDNIKEGILQGFSKEGWSTEYEYRYKQDGEFDYILIKKMQIINLSIVAAPANSLSFDTIKETKIQNATKFVNNTPESDPENLENILFE